MNTFYPDQAIESVRVANNIVDIIGSRVRLAKKGKYYFGLCPFHNEKTPSFSVDEDKQFYYCYSCNKGGDIFKFLIETERLTFTEAVQKLAERAGVILPESSDPAAGGRLAREKKQRDRYFEMYAHAASFYCAALTKPNAAAARDYLQKRAIKAETAGRFGIGYSYPDWDALHKFLTARGFTDEELLSGGLILKNKNGGFYDRFRNRIMFPICDASGKVLAFGGRALSDSDVKYINSPETAFFSKGKCLYGLHLAKNAKEKHTIIVEGYMDLVALSGNGFNNVVAPLGTALTELQAKLLKRYTDDVITAFDADAAGQAATLRGLGILESHGFRVRVLSIPDGKDPDDFVRKNGPEAFASLLQTADTLVGYKIGAMRRSYPEDGGEGDIRFLKGAVGILAGVNDEMEREIYISRISAKYGISEKSIYSEIEKALASRGRSPSRAAGQKKREAPRQGGINDTPRQGGIGGTPANDARTIVKPRHIIKSNSDTDELFVAALLSVDGTLWDVVAENLPMDCIGGENVKKALEYACEQASKGLDLTPGHLMRFFTAEEGDLFAKIVADGCHCEDNRRAMELKIKEIRVNCENRRLLDVSRAAPADVLANTDKKQTFI